MKHLMSFSTYLRVEHRAGGAWASDRAFIRAMRSCLSGFGRSRDGRELRRQFFAAGFEHRADARDLCAQHRL